MIDLILTRGHWVGRFLVMAGLLVFADGSSMASADSRASAVSFEGAAPQVEFSRKASNGYSISFEANRGKATFAARSNSGSVMYSGRSSMSNGRVHFSLGKLGRIDVRFKPDGSVDHRRPPSYCTGREQTVRSGAFVGSIRFRGENGYTQLNTHRVHGEMATPRSWKCRFPSGGSTEKTGVPMLVARTPHNRVVFIAIGGSELFPFRLFIAGTSERRGALRIARSVLEEGKPFSFKAQGDLTSATVAPPKPFTGTAAFVRNADGSAEWSGTLSVSLPNAKGIALTGPTFTAELAKLTAPYDFSELLGLN